MSQVSKLQETITALIQGKADLILYGNKSSGKTQLATKILNKVSGKNKYIHIKGIFITNIQQFLYLFTCDMIRILHILMFQNMLFYQLNINQHPKNTKICIKNINDIIQKNQKHFQSLPKRIYIFVDNVECLPFSLDQLNKIYQDFKNKFNHIKISFFFCGQFFNAQNTQFRKSFRSIICYYMPKPNLQQIMEKTIRQFNYHHTFIKSQDFDLLVGHIKQVLSQFLIIQNQIQRIKMITQNFIRAVYFKLGCKRIGFQQLKMKYYEQEKWVIEKLKRQDYENLEFYQKYSSEMQNEQNNQLREYAEKQQNYPNLIKVSLALANKHPQNEDFERFKDKKGYKRKQNLFCKSLQMQEQICNKESLKKQNTSSFQNLQRIISISEVVEQLSVDSLLLQKNLPHHTLDYYGCIPYLKSKKQIFYEEKRKKSQYGGLISGNPQQSQSKRFMNKLGLYYI